MQKATIMEEYKQSTFAQIAGDGRSSAPQQNRFKDLIIELTRIVCKKQYRKNAMEYVQREYFPIEDCLQICEEKGVIDACAVLYKRKGEYEKSIELYIKVLARLSKEKVISAVFVNADIPFNDPEIKNASIKRFDEILTMIIEICDKEGSRRLKEEEAERLWLKAIEMIYQIKQEVSDELQDLDQKDLNNFHIFLLTRIQAFMMRMAEYVSLEKIINFLQRIGKQNTYSEFQPTFEEKVKRETYNENILNNATDLILKDIMADSASVEQLRVGIPFLFHVHSSLIFYQIGERMRCDASLLPQVLDAIREQMGQAPRRTDVQMRPQLPPALRGRQQGQLYHLLQRTRRNK